MIPMMITRSHNLPPKNSAAHRSRVFSGVTQPNLPLVHGSSCFTQPNPGPMRQLRKGRVPGGCDWTPQVCFLTSCHLVLWRLKDMFRVASCFYFWNIQVCFCIYLFIYSYIYMCVSWIFDRTMNDRIAFSSKRRVQSYIQANYCETPGHRKAWWLGVSISPGSEFKRSKLWFYSCCLL